MTQKSNENAEQSVDLIIRGQFERPDGSPIPGAAVHKVFLGDPPSNVGTRFDLEQGSAITDANGNFSITLQSLDQKLACEGPSGTWKQGCMPFGSVF
jgi:hypothetical protein